MRRKFVVLAVVAAGVAWAGASPGYGDPGMLTVAKAGDTSGCAHHAQFNTIQAAVNAASAGSTIQICPGTYQEYVFIPPALNHLTLRGMGPNPGPGQSGVPVILFPTTPNSQSLSTLHTDSLVTVDGATNVTIQGLEISGPFTDGGCEPETASHVGVYVGGGGQAQLQHDYVTNVQNSNPALLGCQDGIGVEAGNDFFFSHAFPQDPGAVNVQDSTVDRYQKDGVLIDGGPSAPSSMIMHDTVTGVGPTSVIASNGVELDDGSLGEIANNTISANQYTQPSTQASGILLFAPGPKLAVHDNKLTANDVGIYVGSPGAGLDVHGNQITGDNTNSDSEDIELDGVSGGQVHDNHLTGGAYGLDAFDGTTGVMIANNQVSNVTAVGIFNEAAGTFGPAATNNTYQGNHATGSGSVDCEDDTTGSGTAGTANTWKDDHGATSSPAGLCKP
jgi:Right handed beta helix region